MLSLSETQNLETFFNKIGFDSKVQAAYPMSASSEINFSDYEILLPVISSLVVVVVIVAVACFLCSRDHHSLFLQSGLHPRHRQQCKQREKARMMSFRIRVIHKSHKYIYIILFNSLCSSLATSSDNKVPFQQQEMSILKELARSGSMTITDSHADSMMVTTTNSGGSGSGTVVGHHTDDYSCLNGKVTTAEHLNHHLR